MDIFLSKGSFEEINSKEAKGNLGWPFRILYSFTAIWCGCKSEGVKPGLKSHVCIKIFYQFIEYTRKGESYRNEQNSFNRLVK